MAVNQMDQVTQQNAAMVEETTAASMALLGESNTLKNLVARFRVAGVKSAALRATGETMRAATNTRKTGTLPVRQPMVRKAAVAGTQSLTVASENWSKF